MRSEDEGRKMIDLLEKSINNEDRAIAMGIRWMMGASIHEVLEHRASLQGGMR